MGVVRFAGYTMDVAAGLIYHGDTRLRLRDQPVKVLIALVERAGQVVTREELRERLWPGDVFVDFDNSLNTAIARLREALDDDADHPRFIETLPKHGYRFIATVSGALSAPGVQRPTRARVVVLPFANLTGDPGQEYFVDAMTDEMINELAELAAGDLALIARTTAMRYKGSNKDVAQIGAELKVEYVLEGSVSRAGDGLAVNTLLVRVSDQSHLWARRYSAEPSDVFTVSAAATEEIGRALGLHGVGTKGDGRGVHRRYDAAAYSEYVQGIYHLDRLNGAFSGYPTARMHLERAIARDPGFALPHEALAHMLWLQAYGGEMAPKDAFAKGILHAVRSLELDSTRAETHALLAQYYKQLEYAWPDIERELRHAKDLNSASSLVGLLYAVGWLMPQGRLDEAIAELERALDPDPLSYEIQYFLAVLFMLARDWERGIQQARLLIEFDPNVAFGPWLLGVALRGKGLADESIAAHRQAVELSGDAPMMLGWTGLALGAAGRTDEARAVLERLREMARTRYVVPTSFAWTYLGLRDVDRAFEWMDRAVEQRDQFMMPIKTYAFLDPIRSDPRFAVLLRKMKLDD